VGETSFHDLRNSVTFGPDAWITSEDRHRDYARFVRDLKAIRK